MKITFADLWRPSGEIDRGTYAVIGFVGFAIKHNLDRAAAIFVFHRPWSLLDYWSPLPGASLTDLSSRDSAFLATMVALALPFIWIGVAQTMKRLRSAGLPAYLVVLFFAPFLNLLFFLLLCLLPQRQDTSSAQPIPRHNQSSVRFFPQSALGSAAMALLFTVPAGLTIAILGTRVLAQYGWGLFVALPFAMGATAALIYGVRQPRSLAGCVGVACLSNVLLGLALLFVAVEGMICLMMALPLALPLAALGGACGYVVQRRRWTHAGAPAFLSLLILFVPVIQWTEHKVALASPIFVVRSAIDIQAPPEAVWKQVVAFTRIAPPQEWIFRAGVAYPIRAEMLGSGPGAERHCVFSTGAFVEPIQIWDEPRQLKFSVTSNPPPLEEWTPYSHIQPPHLHGFLVSEGGQFLLTPLPSGGTRLQGTTWYRHGLWPANYWKIWSDVIIHRIHMRVLRHIKEAVEAG